MKTQIPDHKAQIPIKSHEPNPKGHAPGDLLERLRCFGESIIIFAKVLPTTVVTSCLIGQLVRASTSVGANYCEADDAESRKDFRHKISLCLKEVKKLNIGCA